MKKNKHIWVITCLIAILTFNNTLQAQYLRDNTKFINLDSFYPKDDSNVFDIYLESEKYQIKINEIFSIPEVMIRFNEKEFPFTFDFGNSDNITITTVLADSISYDVTDTTYTYTPDGKIRGQICKVNIPEFQVLGRSFYNEKGTFADWSIYSTNPFNGLIGLRYLSKLCFTLSYSKKTIAITNRSIISKLSPGHSIIIPLEHYSMHPYGLHFKGKVNGQDAIIYFDTGKSYSEINRNLVPIEKIVSDKSGTFYDGTVEIVFETSSNSIMIYYPRVKDLKRNIESNLPVGIDVGSDILKNFLITVDRTDNHNLLIIHK